MGRPERPLDPEAGPVQRLAHELRELRRAAGNPSYRCMTELAGFSVTTLAHAAGGERLPSLAVVRGYVRACGGDPGEWEPRWKETEALVSRACREDPTDVAPPYRGLARFEPDDRELFFGRDDMIDQLHRLVRDHRLAVLSGASGSGKSSLLRAGLIPRLREEMGGGGRPAVLRVLTPGARPATTYGHLLTPAADEPESWVVVDQFEEVFTLCHDRWERSRFIDLLLAARAPDSGLRVLITVRADFYARCGEHRGLADVLNEAGLLLGPMTADELRDAVVKPAQAVGHLVERELTARLVEDVVDEPGALPMLSHALLETWRRRKGRLLTLAAYEAAGGVRGAIAASAEAVYGQLSPQRARTLRLLLLRLVEPGQGTPDTRRPLPRADLDGCADPEVGVVVERLARARLLTVDEDVVQLAHEALITCWPRLHGWVEEQRDLLRRLKRLKDSADDWLTGGRDPGLLYRGPRLDQAERVLLGGEHADLLTAVEREFLTAALRAREAERRTAAQTARRGRRLRSALTAVLAVALVAGLVAVQQHRDNQRRRTDDAARRVAEVADALRTTDPRTAQLLGVAAWRISRLPETRRALLGSLTQPETDTFTDPAPGDSPARFLTDSGRTLLSVDGPVWHTWDVAGHRRIAAGRLPAGGSVLAVSPDARLLAVQVAGQGVRLWDTDRGRWTAVPALPDDTADVHFTADGRAFGTDRMESDRVTLRSAADGRVLFETPAGSLAHMAPSADGARVALCQAGRRTPQVRDLGGDRVLPGHWTAVADACAHRDTSMLVAGAGSGARFAAVTPDAVRVWDTRSGDEIAEIDDRHVSSAAFSRDGSFLATADGRELRVWRLSDPGAPVFRRSLNNQHLRDDPAWDPVRPVLRYLEGGTVHTLDLGGALTTAWRPGPVNDVLFSPDGRTYATVRRSGDHYVFRLSATTAGRAPRTLPPVPVPVSSDPGTPVVAGDTLPLMAFSPDGGALVYGVSAPGRKVLAQPLTVWDPARGRARARLDLPGRAVLSLALDTGGRTLYAARAPDFDEPDGEIADEVWDTRTGRRTAVLDGMASTHLAVGPDGERLVGDGSVARLPAGRDTRMPADRDPRMPVGRVTRLGLVGGDQVGDLAFSADGSLLAAGDRTGRVALWDGRLRRRIGVLRNVFPAPLDDTPEAVSALAFSPDGRTLAVGGDAGSVQLWDVATQQPLGGPLTTPGEAVASLAFAPEGRTLYAGSAHVPLQRYAVDPARARETVCARTGGTGLSRAQWRTSIPDAGFLKICGA
ncbi:WD40 repeat domain-containing protein [Streptomyces lincolnensis]|uniref:WD40 repeat domain-containing protein n=1 Tax=Streptomyces lincolnensis TaxID=1915 RepID=UPI0037D31696